MQGPRVGVVPKHPLAHLVASYRSPLIVALGRNDQFPVAPLNISINTVSVGGSCGQVEPPGTIRVVHAP